MAAEIRLGQRLQLQERSAAAAQSRQVDVALDRASYQHRAVVRLFMPMLPLWVPCALELTTHACHDAVSIRNTQHTAEPPCEMSVQEDSRRSEEAARQWQLAVKGRQDLEQQINGNAHLRQLAQVREAVCHE